MPPISRSPQHTYFFFCAKVGGNCSFLTHASVRMPRMDPITKPVPSPLPPDLPPPTPGLKLQPVAWVTLRGSIMSLGNRLQDHTSVPGFAPLQHPLPNLAPASRHLNF